MFYVTADGKQVPINEKSLVEYKRICKEIWGAVPYDVSWAMESPLYKQQLKKEHGSKDT